MVLVDPEKAKIEKVVSLRGKDKLKVFWAYMGQRGSNQAFYNILERQYHS
jgi:hypothetical protein